MKIKQCKIRIRIKTVRKENGVGKLNRKRKGRIIKNNN